nr:RNA-directed DNA polymerase, eukaryota [Tanacetum cinerariifolium]
IFSPSNIHDLFSWLDDMRISSSEKALLKVIRGVVLWSSWNFWNEMFFDISPLPPWMTVNGDNIAAVKGEFLPENVRDNDETKGMLNSGGLTTVVNDEEKNEMKSMLTWQNDDTKRLVTCQLPETEFVTDEMLTWQNKEEDEEELSKFLDEALSEMMTCPKEKGKIVNDYLYWLPLKFQTSSAYVTINGNEELCGSSFYDSDTSYMAGISGAWSGVAWGDGGAVGGV